jgi:hypothetical protein
MNAQKKQALFKALRYWLASYAAVAGFLYYKSNVTLGAVLLAGILTFVVTVGRVWWSRPGPDPS